MKKPFLFFTVAAAGVIVGSLLTTLFAQSNRSSDWRSLERAYAEANLELAKARLGMALNQKKMVADSVPDDTLSDLEANVEFAQDRLAQLKSNRNTTFMTAAIAAAELDLKGTQNDYNKSLEANKIAAGAVPDLQVQLEAAELAAAKARLAVVRALGQQPAEVRVQWQIAQLQDEIRALRARPLIEN